MNQLRMTNKMSPIQRLLIKGKQCKDEENSAIQNTGKRNYNALKKYDIKSCEKAIMIYLTYQTEYNDFEHYYKNMSTKTIQSYNNMSRLSPRNNVIYGEIINIVTDRLKEMSAKNDTVGICIMLEAFKNAFFQPFTKNVIFSNNASVPMTPVGKELENYTKLLMSVTKQKCSDPNMPQLIDKFLGYSNNFQEKLENTGLRRNDSGIGSNVSNNGLYKM